MASQHGDYPEVVPDSGLPEVYNQHQYQQPWPQHTGSPGPGAGQSILKPEEPAYYDQSLNPQPNSAPPASTALSTKRGRTICGCTAIVFLLSIIIALLSAAVVGLSAGTGVAASQYHDANAKLEALHASYSSVLATATSSGDAASASSSSTPNSFSSIDNGCSDENENTTGTTYQSDFFDKEAFTMYCNKDASGLMFSLFASDFNNCMSACTAWNHYNSTKGDCGGVSYIPLWSDMAIALEGQAPGDCYLKPKPQTKDDLKEPNVGTECHAAILK